MPLSIQELLAALQGQSGQYGQGGGGGNAIPISGVQQGAPLSGTGGATPPVSGIPAPTPLSGQPMSDQGSGLAGAPSGDMSGMGPGMGRSPVNQMASLDFTQPDMSQLLNQLAASQPGALGSLLAGVGGAGGGSLGQFGGGGSVGQGYGGQYGAGGVIGQQDPRVYSPPTTASGTSGLDLKSMLGGLGGALSLGMAGNNLYNAISGPDKTASPQGDSSTLQAPSGSPADQGVSSQQVLGATPWGGSPTGAGGEATPWGGVTPGAASNAGPQTPPVSGLEQMTGAQGGGAAPQPFDYGVGQGGQGGLPAGGSGFMGQIGDLGRSIGNFGIGPVNVGSVAPYAGGLINLGTGLASGNQNQIGAGVTGLGTAGATSLFPTAAQTAANATAEGLGGAGAASGLASAGAGLTSAGAMAAAQFIGDVLSGQAKDGGHGIGQGQRWGQAALNVIPGLNSILGAFGIDPYAPSKAWQTFPARAAQDFGARNQELGDFARQLYAAQSPQEMRADIQGYNKAMAAIPGGPLNKGQYGINQMPDFDPFETHGYFLPGTEGGSWLPVQYDKGTQLGYTTPKYSGVGGMVPGGGGDITGSSGMIPSQGGMWGQSYGNPGMPTQGGMWGGSVGGYRPGMGFGAQPGQQGMPGAPAGYGAGMIPGQGGPNISNIAQEPGSMSYQRMLALNPAYAEAHKMGRYQQGYGNIDQLIAARTQGLDLPANFWTS